MKRIIFAVAVVFLFVSVAQAAGPKTYQVTGPVLEKKDGVIVVQKGQEKWEIATTKDTKLKGDVKVGAKVTIEYTMTATSIEVKEDKKATGKAPAPPTPPVPAKAPAAPAKK